MLCLSLVADEGPSGLFIYLFIITVLLEVQFLLCLKHSAGGGEYVKYDTT